MNGGKEPANTGSGSPVRKGGEDVKGRRLLGRREPSSIVSMSGKTPAGPRT